MNLNIATNDVCKRCDQLIRTAFISRHPVIPRMAQRSLECTSCGLTSVVDLPLGPDAAKAPTKKLLSLVAP